MTLWDLFLELVPDNRPATTIVMEVKCSDELLEEVANGGMVHCLVYVIQGFRNASMTLNTIELNPCCSLESFKMNAKPTEIADDEAFQFLGLYIEPSQTILRMTIKCYAIVKRGG